MPPKSIFNSVLRKNNPGIEIMLQSPQPFRGIFDAEEDWGDFSLTPETHPSSRIMKKPAAVLPAIVEPSAVPSTDTEPHPLLEEPEVLATSAL